MHNQDILFYIRQYSLYNFNIRDTTICGSFRLCYIVSPERFRKCICYHEVNYSVRVLVYTLHFICFILVGLLL